jgi:hypothetical protein
MRNKFLEGDASIEPFTLINCSNENSCDYCTIQLLGQTQNDKYGTFSLICGIQKTNKQLPKYKHTRELFAIREGGPVGGGKGTSEGDGSKYD